MKKASHLLDLATLLTQHEAPNFRWQSPRECLSAHDLHPAIRQRRRPRPHERRAGTCTTLQTSIIYEILTETQTYDGPITDVTSNDVICNGGPNPLNQPLPTDIINVKAGDKLTTEWHHTLDSTSATDKADPIDPGHLGPIMIYLAKVDSALTTTVTGLKWFKVYEDGLDSNGTWAVTRLYNNKGKMEFTLPKCIQNGQ